ncbi:argininosuccinate lyase [Sulfobacillus sp. hq2]|uniref:argininosuccinate lyase n=1 Tax=Sulfobacillus TaxID=28033 RepID=UPI001FA92E94|nr:argininosuccinate lyase [Sulfobacillus sp. hq2]MCY0906993.1 argininosuccinate lyase [Sulfobacillus thermotolerans]
MEDMARSPRLAQGLDRNAAHFTASVFFDWRLLPYDIAGSMAHITMLAEQNIVTQEAKEQILAGLEQVRQEWEQGTLTPRVEWEDVHMNVEGRLGEIIGPISGVLHTARSRNDQVAVDMHLYMLDVAERLKSLLYAYIKALTDRAEQDFGVIIPGYTHMQAAQPILLSHHWLAYKSMAIRDFERLQQWQQRTNLSPLGAGALSGTPYPTDPARTASLLGLSSVYDNSVDAVSDRDFLLEFLAWAAITMVHLSRLAEELVLWSSVEFGYVRISDAYSTGSSIMPQKRNPDVAELTRGKAGRVIGRLQGLLTTMKGLPLAYDSDMQEDKEAVFDVVDTMDGVLTVVPGMLNTLEVNRERIARRIGQDYTAATDLADILVQNGMTFREAHHLVGMLVTELEKHGKGFGDADPDWLHTVAPEIQPEWLRMLTPERLVAKRLQPMGTAPERVTEQIQATRQWLAEHQPV